MMIIDVASFEMVRLNLLMVHVDVRMEQVGLMMVDRLMMVEIVMMIDRLMIVDRLMMVDMVDMVDMVMMVKMFIKPLMEWIEGMIVTMLIKMRCSTFLTVGISMMIMMTICETVLIVVPKTVT